MRRAGDRGPRRRKRKARTAIPRATLVPFKLDRCEEQPGQILDASGTSQGRTRTRAVVHDRYGPPEVMRLKEVAARAEGRRGARPRPHLHRDAVRHRASQLRVLVRLRLHGSSSAEAADRRDGAGGGCRGDRRGRHRVPGGRRGVRNQLGAPTRSTSANPGGDSGGTSIARNRSQRPPTTSAIRIGTDAIGATHDTSGQMSRAIHMAA